MTQEELNYTNDPKPKGYTFVLALPGSGGNLLLELMALAGMTPVTGTQEPSFYHAITVIAESLSSNGNDYGDAGKVAACERGLRFYGRESKEYDINLTYYYLRNILMKNGSGCGFGLTEILRDEDYNWLSRYVQVLRDISDHSGNHKLRVVFLTRDFNDGELSIIEQLQEFKDASELGDIWIKKSELLSDPKKVMMKLRCSHYPNEDKIKQIMKRYETTL